MRIQYEEVVSEYERALRTQLRGFKPSQAFLETWVHDEDPARSILSMVEAAGLEGLASLDIALGAETARGLDRARLLALTAREGRVALEEVPGGLVLKVSYA